MLRVCFASVLLVGVAVAAPVPQSRPTAPPPHPADPDATLVLVQEVPNKEGSVTRRRLLRVGFRNGVMRPPETVWEGDQRFLGHFGGHRIVGGGRFLVTARGGVIDMTTGHIVNPEMDGTLDAVEGPLVYYWVANALRPEGMFTFDLTTRAVQRVSKLGEGRLALRGLRSPNGAKSVQANFAELTLYQAGEKPKSLGKDFAVKMSVLSSWLPSAPVLWLDDGRVLTQVNNGELVAVGPDGKRAEVVKIPIEKDPVTPPRLSRDPAGRVVYECGDEAFEIDAKARKWARIEWVNLGHGFEVSWKAEPKPVHTFRHNGREIGKLLAWPGAPGRIAATEGHLAVTTSTDGSGTSGAMSVRIWSAKSGEWSTLKLWPNCLVGWVK